MKQGPLITSFDARSNHGVFTISLDFELHWGVRDKKSIDDYRQELLGARAAIPRMLDAFSEYGVHATWATVGFLFYSTKEELLENAPRLRPGYTERSYNPYFDMDGVGNDEASDPFHFAPSLIKEITSRPGQEVATHTLSHFYCLEEGQTKPAFRADIEAAIKAAEPYGVEIRSLVFPRNQCNPEYFDVLSELGIIAYRGNPRAWMYRSGTDCSSNSFFKRLARFTDTYFSLTSPNLVLSSLGNDAPLDIRATRFLRPTRSNATWRDTFHLRRVKNEMTAAARSGCLYHLWWHPHNFGLDTDVKIKYLAEILRHYTQLRLDYGMRSLTMSEIAQAALQVSPDTRLSTDGQLTMAKA